MQRRKQGWRRTASATVGLAFAVTVIGPTAEAAVRYTHTRYDPNDVSSSVDIRSTKRSVLQKKRSERVLKVVLRGYQDWPSYPDGAEGVIKLDTRGGPLADARLRIRFGEDFLCILVGQNAEYDFKIDGDWAACRVPFSWLRDEGAKPNKQIRWKVKLTPDGGGQTDRAPNSRGWYP